MLILLVRVPHQLGGRTSSDFDASTMSLKERRKKLGNALGSLKQRASILLSNQKDKVEEGPSSNPTDHKPVEEAEHSSNTVSQPPVKYILPTNNYYRSRNRQILDIVVQRRSPALAPI